jgi:putative ABC transport system substrate-binding protein
VPRIGILSIGTPDGTSPRSEAFRQALRDLGYVDGRNIAIETRWATAERLSEHAAGLVDQKVDVIVATSTPTALAVRKASGTIPIVFVTAADPVGSGLVASIARPGGNATGVSLLAPEIVARQVQLLKEAVPRAGRVTVLSNPTNKYDASLLKEVESAARSMAIRTRVLRVSGPDALDGVLSAVAKERPDALFVLFDPMMFTQRARIADFTSRHRLPLMTPHREYAEAGGLMAYGVDLRDNYRRAASYVDKILKGAKPADLPVEQPTKFELVINLRTASALGLTIPLLLHERTRSS